MNQAISLFIFAFLGPTNEPTGNFYLGGKLIGQLINWRIHSRKIKFPGAEGKLLNFIPRAQSRLRQAFALACLARGQAPQAWELSPGCLQDKELGNETGQAYLALGVRGVSRQDDALQVAPRHQGTPKSSQTWISCAFPGLLM